jgi:hypothetical protein
MVAKKPKAQARTKSPELSVVAPVEGSPETEAARLLQSSQACPKAQWILVDEGQGLAQELAKHASLKSLHVETARSPRASGDWAPFLAATPLLTGKACLMLPKGVTLGSLLFKQLSSALKTAELVFSRRPGAPFWPLRLQGSLWSLPGLDFGSPLLARHERWISLTQGKDPQALFLGPRIAKEAMRSQVPVMQCEATEFSASVRGLSVLGEEARASKLKPSLIQLLGGSFLFLISLFFIMPRSNFLGLTLLGVSFFAICTVVGEE